MYKCLECGRVFEQTHNYRERHGERFRCCPYCNGDFAEAMQCDDCGEWFYQDELYHDRHCEKCLTERVTYDSFLGFLEDGTPDLLDDFFFGDVWGVEAAVSGDKSRMLADLRELYKRRAANDKLLGKTEFLGLCRKAVKEYWLDAFADWLDGKRKE